MANDPDPDRPGFHDLVTPFIFVKHGDPDPVEWKRANPGWVSFPATFIPHKRPPPKWTILNGRRWPLDKRGQPWPRSRFGQPLCPLDEFPPGVPAPGTQGKLIAEQEAKLRETVALVRSGELTVDWFLQQGVNHRAERAAREAAHPAPPPPPTVHTYEPMAPARAYLAYRAREADAMRAASEDSRYQTATDAERREMPDAVLIRNGAAQLAFARQAERRPAVLAAGGSVAVSGGTVAVPASALLGLARTAAGLAQLAAAGFVLTPAGLAALTAAAAAGTVVYLLQRQHRSLVDQGALPAAPPEPARSMGYDAMGASTGMPDPSGPGDEPRALAPLPGFGEGAPRMLDAQGPGFTPSPTAGQPQVLETPVIEGRPDIEFIPADASRLPNVFTMSKPIDITEPIEVAGARPIDRGASYEEAIRKLHGIAPGADRGYKQTVKSVLIEGKADALINNNRKVTAVGAKYIDKWSESLSSPNSSVGRRHFAEKDRADLIGQALRYAKVFPGRVIYYTSSSEFAELYSKIFDQAGIKDITFVVTPINFVKTAK